MIGIRILYQIHPWTSTPANLFLDAECQDCHYHERVTLEDGPVDQGKEVKENAEAHVRERGHTLIIREAKE